jgi:hypothetical protein
MFDVRKADMVLRVLIALLSYHVLPKSLVCLENSRANSALSDFRCVKCSTSSRDFAQILMVAAPTHRKKRLPTAPVGTYLLLVLTDDAIDFTERYAQMPFWSSCVSVPAAGFVGIIDLR